MLTRYIQASMDIAKYELIEDGTFIGEIPGLQGVIANHSSLEGCRNELQSVLEGWIILGLRLGHAIPVIDEIQLDAELEMA